MKRHEKDLIYQWFAIRTKKNNIMRIANWLSIEMAPSRQKPLPCMIMRWEAELNEPVVMLFLFESDKLEGAFLEHISFRLKPLILIQEAANLISSVSRRHLEGSTLKS